MWKSGKVKKPASGKWYLIGNFIALVTGRYWEFHQIKSEPPVRVDIIHHTTESNGDICSVCRRPIGSSLLATA